MTHDSPDDSDQIVSRTPEQPAGGRVSYDTNGGGFTLDDIHPLFDIPVVKTTERFLSELEEQAADKTWANDYDDLDVMVHKCEQAIQEVLDIDAQTHEACADVAAENLYSAHPDSWDTWEQFATSWIGQYLTIYNSQVARETPAVFDTLVEALDELADDPRVPNEVVEDVVTGRLGDA